VYMDVINLGDMCDLRDGIYIGFDEAIVVRNGIVIAKFDHLVSKWGDKVPISSFFLYLREQCLKLASTEG